MNKDLENLDPQQNCQEKVLVHLHILKETDILYHTTST